MTMKKQVAESIMRLMLEVTEKLDQSVALVQQEEAASAEQYRSAIAQILGVVLLDVVNPILAEYPELRPEGLE